jgi:hypothetical protein
MKERDFEYRISTQTIEQAKENLTRIDKHGFLLEELGLDIQAYSKSKLKSSFQCGFLIEKHGQAMQKYIEVGKESFKELEKTKSREIYIQVVIEYIRAVLEQAKAVRELDFFLKSVEGEKDSFPICPWGF